MSFSLYLQFIDHKTQF